ncbi:InlB B-repeat-containing protein [Candidatus Saccharibacteria bacterium]|nr:InlB B-repeat-containing protein [Candidatus Saccharibacteria bacterium]
MAGPVFAEGNVFKLVAAEITDRSSTTEAKILGASDSKITNNIVFHSAGEYVTFNLGFKNTDSEPRKIISVGVSDENDLLEYEYESSVDATIDPGEIFELTLKATYINEINDPSQISQIFSTTITITLEKTNEYGETEEITEDIVVPSTGAKATPGAAAYGSIALAASIGVVIVSLFYVRKHKKANLPVIAIAVAATTFSISCIVSATSTVDEDFYMENDTTFYYRECSGVCYYGNGDDGIGTMADQEADPGDEIVLTASNFSRLGYGFAGWNTRADGSGTNYGPNQIIEMSGDKLRLYANWIESAGTMTGFTCGNLSIGEVTALTDERDDQTYAVARLADGNCWTIENMRSVTENSFNENTENRDDEPASDGAIYGYGNYYNGRDNSYHNICPTGWNVPTYEYGLIDEIINEFEGLGTAIGGETALEKIKNWTSYPNNFVFAGFYYAGMSESLGTDYAYRGGAGYYQGQVTYNYNNINWDIATALLALPGIADGNEAVMEIDETNADKSQGLSARCRIYPTRDVTLSYDANGGEGPVPEPQTITTTDLWADGYIIGDEEPTREHHTFIGWATEDFKDVNPNNTDEWGVPYRDYAAHAGDEFSLYKNTTIYALWEKGCTTIHYLSNDGDESAPEMGDQVVCPPDNEIIDLMDPDYRREGYSYIGWNTEADGSGTMYGPNQNIEVPDLDDFYLYAQWIQAEEDVTMQTFDGTAEPYASADTNTVIALRDERDNQIYAVAKLADDNWWMIEDLRLDLNDANTNVTAANTDNPTQDFLDEYNTNFHGNAASTTPGCPASAGYTCWDRISFKMKDYSGYGGNYNWYTVTAGNSKHDTSGYAGGSICPAGWRLPRSETGEDFSMLDVALGGSGGDDASIDGSNRWRSYPVNIIYNLDHGEKNYLWGGNAGPVGDSEIGLGLQVLPGELEISYGYGKMSAYSARCVAEHEETFTLTYVTRSYGDEELEAPVAQTGISADGYFEFTVSALPTPYEGSDGWCLSSEQFCNNPDYYPGDKIRVKDLHTTLKNSLGK